MHERHPLEQMQAGVLRRQLRRLREDQARAPGEPGQEVPVGAGSDRPHEELHRQVIYFNLGCLVRSSIMCKTIES